MRSKINVQKPRYIFAIITCLGFLVRVGGYLIKVAGQGRGFVLLSTIGLYD